MIAYVTNGGWLDSNTADGMRQALAEEFSSVYVFNLRGNQRTAGEDSRKEGGKVFGSGSRATVAITILVKSPDASGPATIHYMDVGDYLSREQKLEKVASAASISGLESVVRIAPNEYGDWLNQRRDDFERFMPMAYAEKGLTGLFGATGPGLQSNRDAWVYNFSASALASNMRQTIEAYERERLLLVKTGHEPTRDPEQISWSSSLEADIRRGMPAKYDPARIMDAAYRPFQRQHLYAQPLWIHRPGAQPSTNPEAPFRNETLYLTGPSAAMDFTVLAVASAPDQAMYGGQTNGKAFSRWWFEKPAEAGMLDLATDDQGIVDGYRKVDNITDEALKGFASVYGAAITKDRIFGYTYGLLHSPEYRDTYAADLKKMLPRIPLVKDPWPFIEAGGKLLALHLGYDSATPFPLDGLDVDPVGDPYDFFRVQKIAISKVRNSGKLVPERSEIVFNSHVTLRGIPEDAYRYMLGSRSAIEWIIERYQVKADKDSGIVNDPNDWSREVGDPRYILDLLARIVTVSLETMQIVDRLPALEILDPA